MHRVQSSPYGVWVFILMLVVVTGFALGYGYRQPSIAGLAATLEERGKQLIAAQEELSSLEAAEFQVRLGLTLTQRSLRDTQTQLQETRTQLDQATDESELLQASVEELTEERDDLLAAFRLQTEIMTDSLESVDIKQSEAFLLIQQGLDAFDLAQYDVAADFIEQAARRYEDSGRVLETIAEKSMELAPQIPLESRHIYTRAAKRARADVEFAAASTAEFLGAARMFNVVDRIDRIFATGEAVTEKDIQRWTALLEVANQDLAQGRQFLDEALSLAPELWRQVEGRLVDFQGWQDLHDGLVDDVAFLTQFL